MKYVIVVARSARKVMDRLPDNERRRMAAAILELKNDPLPPGKKVKELKGVDGNVYRLRVGGRRVIYEISRNEIHVLSIINRNDLDRWLKKR